MRGQRADAGSMPGTDALGSLAALLRARILGLDDVLPSTAVDDLLPLAASHRVDVLVAERLLARPDLEAGPRRAAEAIARAAAVRAVAAVEAMHRAQASLAQAGIPSLAWKGPCVAVMAWGSAAARTFDDLDLVVRPRDVAPAREVLAALGWTPPRAMTPRQASAIYSTQGAIPFTREGAPGLLELHWRFAARRYAGVLDAEGVFRRAEPLGVGGLVLRSPSPADTLALAVMHATKHGWSTLEDVATVAALLARHPGARADAHARLRAVGGGRAWDLAERLVGDLMASRSGAPADRLARAVEARWRSGTTTWRPDLAWDLGWTVGARDRARLLLRSLFDPTLQEWLALRLPDPLLPAYRALRPLRLLWRALTPRR